MTQPHGQQSPADAADPRPGEHPAEAEPRPRAWREYGTLLMAIVGLTLSLTTFLATALR
ncbi:MULTISPECIES: hypothetical protein [unclassified Streptomyces]|uniref:hypothetical protein n=1 Tax=unclassified Streptomyces TaxID=2593676 RepID=UPI002DD8AF0F|nr:hypothetical protein [Streptomyces sp. NBC_01445]WSE02870.1 hypothetical protein OG574_05390 [Streptomyces sp. NBC_01445]